MSSFSSKLIHWQQSNGRHHLPWQNTRDPYSIWVSEIMLQQTQVATVIPYYLRFLQYFPNVEGLASASLDDVLAKWSGLGYYSRGRNLHRTARLVMAHYGGIFPNDYQTILRLPGIGRSTAAAIAAFAYGARCAILDGNVKRIFARYFGIESYPGERKTEILLWQKAEELLPVEAGASNSGIEAYTQALMDLGATVCTRLKPKCAICPLSFDCFALRNDDAGRLPARRPRKPLPEKETALLILMAGGTLLLEKRPGKGVWPNLWCLPEMPVGEDPTDYCARRFGMGIRPLANSASFMSPFTHTFTHF
ncbi:MAG TPA: A/G-specific adenine glycosylase, partial [Candidatus Acidoferrum sp.]|nr:A/G-specific adenine glycosylase [Candidatus Acidoferrum sp.]